MSDNSIQIIGDEDQEVMFRAMVHYIHLITKKSKNIIRGLLRLSIQEVSKTSNISLDEAKFLTPEKRKELIENGIEEFIRKAKIGAVQRRKIKEISIQIYERWKWLSEKNKSSKKIELYELIDDESSNLMGYEDQEVLLAAFCHYITNTINSDKDHISKMIRTSMLEVTIDEKISFKEARYLDEDKRGRLIEKGIEQFITAMQLKPEKAKIIRADCLKVYNRWKEIRRIDPSREEIELFELLGQTR